MARQALIPARLEGEKKHSQVDLSRNLLSVKGCHDGTGSCGITAYHAALGLLDIAEIDFDVVSLDCLSEGTPVFFLHDGLNSVNQLTHFGINSVEAVCQATERAVVLNSRHG